MEELLEFISVHLVKCDFYGTYTGLSDPTLDELMALRELVNTAISEKVYELNHPDA